MPDTFTTTAERIPALQPVSRSAESVHNRLSSSVTTILERASPIGVDRGRGLGREERGIQMPQQKQGRNPHLPGFEDQKLVPVGQIPYDLLLDGIRLEYRFLGELGSDLVEVRDSPLPVADALVVFSKHGGSVARIGCKGESDAR